MDLIDLLFKDQQLLSWNKNKGLLIEHIKKQTNQFVFDYVSITDDDCKKRIGDDSYLNDLEITGIPGGIKCIYPSLDIWNEIKQFIPKTITSLSIPKIIFLEDYQFLKEFPNLETIYVENVILNKEIIDYLVNNTNIKQINTNFLYLDYDELTKIPNSTLVEGKQNKVFSDIIINSLEINEYNDCLKISTNIIDINRVISILESEDLSNYESIIINDIYTIDMQKRIIQTTDCNAININLLANYLKSVGIIIERIELNVEKIDYTKIDYNPLNTIASTYDLKINYEKYPLAEFEDFKNMVETIKWYRSMIMDFDLSPLEKLMFAYDIMKTFKYHENDSNKNMARYPDKILKSGDIVCVGYANFLKDILKGLDEGLMVNCSGVSAYDVKNNCFIGHERNLVKIDDDKYNIHGIYALDATWDSVLESDKAKSLGDSYNALDLYSYFLIPYNDYEKTFGKDTMPSLFRYYAGVLGDSKDDGNYKLSDWPVKQTISDLFDKYIVTEDELHDYLQIKRPNLEIFLRMLHNVRLAEGYPEEFIDKELKRVEEINSNAVSSLQQSGLDIEFFTR